MAADARQLARENRRLRNARRRLRALLRRPELRRGLYLARTVDWLARQADGRRYPVRKEG